MEAFNEILQSILGEVLGSFLSVIGSVILYTLLGFILAIICIIVIVKMKWAKRENIAWNILAKVHYLVFFIAFIVVFPMLGGTRAFHNTTTDVVVEYISPTIENQLNTFQQAAVSSWGDDIDNAILTVEEAANKLLSEINSETEGSNDLSGRSAEMFSWFSQDFIQQLVTSTLIAMVNTGINKTTESVGISADDIEFSLAEFRNADFSQSGTKVSSFVQKNLLKQVNSFFAAQYFGLGIIFLLIAGLSIIEMAIYNLFFRKPKKLNESTIASSIEEQHL